MAREAVFDEVVKRPPWWAVGDRDKAGSVWMGAVPSWRH